MTIKRTQIHFNEKNFGPSENQAQQSIVFRKLEKGLPISYKPEFGSLVHFQGSSKTPIQRWYPYREGFSTKLVEHFVQEFNIFGNVFDPFSGSGTTLLVARQSNINSYGIDVNPISILVSKVENETYNANDVNNLSREIQRLSLLSKSNEQFHTTFNLSERVFNQEILQTLLQLKHHIYEIQNRKIRDLIFVAWLSIIEDVSNIKKEGNGIKYKNRRRTSKGYININKELWEKQVFPVDKFSYVKIKLQKQLEIILNDIQNDYGSTQYRPNIFQGSCLEFDSFFTDEIDFSFFSPPYCNCFDYFEIHKVELWLGDFVKVKEDVTRLKNTGFRSNTNSLNHKSITYKNSDLENLIDMLDYSRLWSDRIPTVIRGYFDDSRTLLEKLYIQTTNGGHVGIVIGNSAYSGVIIPSDILLANIAKEIGFSVMNVFVTRHLTTSSQQKIALEEVKENLRESIVLLKK